MIDSLLVARVFLDRIQRAKIPIQITEAWYRMPNEKKRKIQQMRKCAQRLISVIFVSAFCILFNFNWIALLYIRILDLFLYQSCNNVQHQQPFSTMNVSTLLRSRELGGKIQTTNRKPDQSLIRSSKVDRTVAQQRSDSLQLSRFRSINRRRNGESVFCLDVDREQR